MSDNAKQNVMVKTLKVRKFGKSLGVILPKQILNELGVGEGDVLYPYRTDNGVELMPKNAEFIEALESTREFMHRHANAMRKLAE